MDEELYHYGVKGMKWGVRRDYRVLANRRRNTAYRQAKDDYDSGKITKAEKKQRYKDARQAKKDVHSEMKNRYRNASKSERAELNRQIKSQTVKEVPHRSIKKGATTVNKLLTGYTIGANVAGVAVGSAIMPAMAPILVTSLVGSTAVNLGMNKLIQMGIDRLS